MNMPTQAAVAELDPRLAAERNRRLKILTHSLSSNHARIDAELNTYGIMVHDDRAADAAVYIVNSFNPRTKNIGGVIFHEGAYRLVTANVRLDLWKLWKLPFEGQVVPDIDLVAMISDLLRVRGVAETVILNHRGSRITTQPDGSYAFGFDSKIVAQVYVGGDCGSDVTSNMYERECVQVNYHGLYYYVKVPHALEAGRGKKTYMAFANALVPLIHAFRSTAAHQG